MALINWLKDKITFVNGKTPAINATNLNNMQNNIEKNLSDFVQEGLNDYVSGLPIGAGCDYYGTEAPSGFMFADGRALSRTDYAELFAIIGTIYGAGDGSTTFNLPDKRSRVSVGYDGESINTSAFTKIGAIGGEIEHTLTISEIPEHTHTYTKISYSSVKWDNEEKASFNKVTGSSSANTGAAGAGQPHNILQPYIVCNYIIKVK